MNTFNALSAVLLAIGCTGVRSGPAKMAPEASLPQRLWIQPAESIPRSDAKTRTRCNAKRIQAELSPSYPHCMTSNEAVRLARGWLDAVRRRDDATLAKLTAIPSSVRGFALNSGPQAEDCGAKRRNDGLVGVRTFDAGLGIQREIQDAGELADVLRCLLLDRALVGSIPVVDDGIWRSTERSGDKTGALFVVTVDRIAPVLEPYRREVDALVETHLLVQARLTDNNGETNHVLLTVPADRPARVDHVYVHELFEE